MSGAPSSAATAASSSIPIASVLPDPPLPAESPNLGLSSGDALIPSQPASQPAEQLPSGVNLPAGGNAAEKRRNRWDGEDNSSMSSGRSRRGPSRSRPRNNTRAGSQRPTHRPSQRPSSPTRSGARSPVPSQPASFSSMDQGEEARGRGGSRDPMMRMLYKLQDLQSRMIEDQRSTRKDLMDGQRSIEAGQDRVEQEIQQVALEVGGRMDQVEAKVDGFEARLSALEARPSSRAQSSPPGPRDRSGHTLPDVFESRVYGLEELDGEVKLNILEQLIKHEAVAALGATIEPFLTTRGPRVPILKFQTHIKRSAFQDAFVNHNLGTFTNGDLVVQFNIKKILPNEAETKVLRNIAYWSHQHLQGLGTTSTFVKTNLFSRNLSFFGTIVAYYVGASGGPVNFGETGTLVVDKKAIQRVLEGKIVFNFEALLSFLNTKFPACCFKIE